VEVGRDRFRGWIDLLAFRPSDGTLAVIEVKTRIDDLGRIVRTIGWYARSAPESAAAFGWRPRRFVRLLAVLATAETETRLEMQRDLVRGEFQGTSAAIATWIDDPSAAPAVAGVVLIDPASRRRSWVIRHRSEGRRSLPPYADYRDAARHLHRA
jgi:hypothetical protein